MFIKKHIWQIFKAFRQFKVVLRDKVNLHRPLIPGLVFAEAGAQRCSVKKVKNFAKFTGKHESPF